MDFHDNGNGIGTGNRTGNRNGKGNEVWKIIVAILGLLLVLYTVAKNTGTI